MASELMPKGMVSLTYLLVQLKRFWRDLPGYDSIGDNAHLTGATRSLREEHIWGDLRKLLARHPSLKTYLQDPSGHLHAIPCHCWNGTALGASDRWGGSMSDESRGESSTTLILNGQAVTGGVFIRETDLKRIYSNAPWRMIDTPLPEDERILDEGSPTSPADPVAAGTNVIRKRRASSSPAKWKVDAAIRSLYDGVVPESKSNAELIKEISDWMKAQYPGKSLPSETTIRRACGRR